MEFVISMKIIYLTVELIVGFFYLFLIVKFVGEKLINHISPFTFIAAIDFGELLGNALYDHKAGVFYIVYSMTIWGALLLAVELLSQKFRKFRGVADANPSALIKNGVVDRDALRKNTRNIEQLQSLLRLRETSSIRESAFCYLEANG